MSGVFNQVTGAPAASPLGLFAQVTGSPSPDKPEDANVAPAPTPGLFSQVTAPAPSAGLAPPESIGAGVARTVGTRIGPAFGGLGAALAGGEIGAGVGAFGGPLAPVTVPVGAAVGAIAGGIGGQALITKAQRAIMGKTWGGGQGR